MAKLSTMYRITLILLCISILAGCKKSVDGYDNTADIEYLENNAVKPGVVVTDSGLQYLVKEEGDGEQPGPSSTVWVHYIGKFINDVEFNNSREISVDPFEFVVGDLIPAWIEGLQLMRKGSVYEFTVPAELAYGEDPPAGPIYPGATLIFTIELIEVID